MAEVSLSPDSENLKRCWKCKTEKPRSEFNQNRASVDGLQGRCRDCGNIACRAWYRRNLDSERERARVRHAKEVYGPKRQAENKRWAAENPDRARYHSRKKLLKNKYNMTIEEHDALFASQGFACAACKSPSPNSKKGWSTDHCHATGVVRGILCHHCNIGIGHAKDNIETIRAWISYLQRAEALPLSTALPD